MLETVTLSKQLSFLTVSQLKTNYINVLGKGFFESLVTFLHGQLLFSFYSNSSNLACKYLISFFHLIVCHLIFSYGPYT